MKGLFQGKEGGSGAASICDYGTYRGKNTPTHPQGIFEYFGESHKFLKHSASMDHPILGK